MGMWYRCRHCKIVVGKSIECRVRCKLLELVRCGWRCMRIAVGAVYSVRL